VNQEKIRYPQVRFHQGINNEGHNARRADAGKQEHPLPAKLHPDADSQQPQQVHSIPCRGAQVADDKPGVSGEHD